MRLAVGLFLIAHGLIHLAWVAPKPDDPAYPFSFKRSAVLPTAHEDLLRPIGIALAIAVAALFLVAGTGFMGVEPLAHYWRLAAISGSMLSALLIGTFWHPWFVLGAMIDLAIVAFVLTGWGPLY